jgi:hypothetical protein
MRNWVQSPALPKKEKRIGVIPLLNIIKYLGEFNNKTT